jgi:hypothetical protein
MTVEEVCQAYRTVGCSSSPSPAPSQGDGGGFNLPSAKPATTTSTEEESNPAYNAAAAAAAAKARADEAEKEAAARQTISAASQTSAPNPHRIGYIVAVIVAVGGLVALWAFLRHANQAAAMREGVVINESSTAYTNPAYGVVLASPTNTAQSALVPAVAPTPKSAAKKAAPIFVIVADDAPNAIASSPSVHNHNHLKDNVSNFVSVRTNHLGNDLDVDTSC